MFITQKCSIFSIRDAFIAIERSNNPAPQSDTLAGSCLQCVITARRARHLTAQTPGCLTLDRSIHSLPEIGTDQGNIDLVPNRALKAHVL